MLLILLVCLFVGSLIALGINFYISNSVVVPTEGGVLEEGLVGNARYFNPLLSSTNEVESDINGLIFAGLLKFDPNGQLVPDLAESYTVSEDGKVYEFILREELIWHDKKPLNADDVLYTFKTIQDPIFKSPERGAWENVLIEQIDQRKIKFTTEVPYSAFLQKLTIGIIPKHLWSAVKPENFSLAELNTKPIGSGPYKFKKLEKTKSGTIKSVALEANKNYHIKEPYISDIIFKIYPSPASLKEAFDAGLISATGRLSGSETTKLSDNYNIRRIKIPRYFSIFFNEEQNSLLNDKVIRRALAMAINKTAIVSDILNDYGSPIGSPLPENVFEFVSYNELFPYDVEGAKALLEQNGWTNPDGENVRQKEGVKLALTLTSIESGEFEKVAEFIKSAWEEIGVKVELIAYNSGSIQTEVIRPRQYQALLFGQALGLTPDTFSFWHSSQKRDPGLNLSLYENKVVDQLLTEIRQDINNATRNEKLKQFKQLVAEEIGGIFLYSSDYIYVLNKSIRGIDTTKIQLPQHRFANIEKWYINTERNLK